MTVAENVMAILETLPMPGAERRKRLQFLLEELKPKVDATWRTDPDRTYIAGSSMGGLISFDAAWRHPDVFRGAACLSPAFVERYGHQCFEMENADRDRLPGIRLFLSCGGAPGLEAELLNGTLKMANLLKGLGYPEKDLSVRIESHAEHNEEAWARMTPHWLRFFFESPQVAEPEPGTREWNKETKAAGGQDAANGKAKHLGGGGAGGSDAVDNGGGGTAAH